MVDVKTEKPIADIHLNADFTATPRKDTMPSKYLRTCLKCGENCYSADEYSTHMAKEHDKTVSASDVSTARKVQTTMANTGQDVPEEILVKPRKTPKTPSKAVAKTRKKRGPNKKKTQSKD